MFTSSKVSGWILRIGLAAVFLWFGADKFIHPNYWLNAWVPDWAVSFLGRFKVTGSQFVYFNGVFEVIVGLSLLTNLFSKFFSFLAILFLISVITMNGINEITVRDIGLIGGLGAILFWPPRPRRF
ncbi:MAG: DoxX family membrane protein [bacterium]|nr:DoxX family membrane protein [bacterium]